MMQEFSNDKEPNTSINPDEAAEYIAAVQDAIRTSEGPPQCRTCCIGRDSLPMGVETGWHPTYSTSHAADGGLYEIGDTTSLT